MTVEQFISKLQEIPKDAEVVITYMDFLGEDHAYGPKPDYYENQNRVYLINESY